MAEDGTGDGRCPVKYHIGPEHRIIAQGGGGT